MKKNILQLIIKDTNLKESNHPENEAKDERGGRSGGKNHNRVSS